MTLNDLKRRVLPERPGVYRFLGKKGNILYIGKATDLKDRVRSYFSATVATRGRHIEDMVREAKRVEWTVTDSVLDALVLESALIKKYAPPYNSKEKDNKSFNYLVITDEDFPRVLVIRERTMLLDKDLKRLKYQRIFGPFPSVVQLKTAIAIIRKIFPFRDRCIPETGKACFNRQIGLCPGVCTGEVTPRQYKNTIGYIITFFSGKKRQLLSSLKKDMASAADLMAFERAGEIKKQIFALGHINDVALIRADARGASRESAGYTEGIFRIEAYDIAHLAGGSTVGAMVVVTNGEAVPGEYRKFRIRGKGKDHADDPINLSEVLSRRLKHLEWPLPQAIVVDGNKVQKRVAEQILRGQGLSIPVVAVTKDERHKPRSMTGDPHVLKVDPKAILLANSEAHRFAISYHRRLARRTRIPRSLP